MKSEAPPASELPAGVVLSDSTKTILQRLDSPVDIKFYSPSVPATLPESLAAYLVRVQRLLSAYEQAGAGNIRVIQSDPALESLAKTTAGAEGVLPFAGNNGEICYLGITVAKAGRKETIPQLSPDWEAALESDVSRAIARVNSSVATPATPDAQAGMSPTPMDPMISEELLRTIPDLESRSFDDAAKILRESALVEFTAAVRTMQGKVQETQKQLAESPGNKSEADQQAAMKQLQQVQAEETKKLDEITARLQARIKVLERLKGVNRPLPK
ncbi:MAG: Gldg family protein [Verrucomicrobiota bacterium]